MKKRTDRYESEVHLGLLVIIVILLFLSFAANYVVYQARTDMRERTAASLNGAALAVSRAVQKEILPELTAEQAASFKSMYGLSGLILIPSRPPDNSPQSRKLWFASIVSALPPGQIPQVARKILSAEFQTLTHGEQSEYFYVYPIPSTIDKKILILSANEPVLAYLDESGNNILVVSVLATLVVIGIYVWLLRYILAPLRRIRQEAVDAGRLVDGDAGEVEAVIEDYRRIIGELKAKESELLELNEAVRLRADSLEHFNQYLLDSIDSGIVTVDNDGNLRSINRSAVRILKLTTADISGRCIGQLFGGNPGLLDVVKCCLENTVGRPYSEYEFITADGQRLALGVGVSVIASDRQTQVGASILINDLTELQGLRKELETKKRLAALGEMAAGLAHQLRNSIGAVVGYSKLVKRRLQKARLEISGMTALDEETRQAELLIERFLNFARPLRPALAPVVLKEVLAELINTFQVRAGNKRIQYRQAGATPGEVWADELLIKQALSNIIDNAVNAYDNGPGLVDIHVTEEEGWQSVTIRDYGCGIAQEDLGKIFTPFFSSRPAGSGLGLALAAKIIDLHQGHIAVTSQPGTGTEFVISLPVQSGAPATTEPSQCARNL
ncbi:MAG: ATP-binding protein [candidate division Zixibacteria bacterium]|nr:ATP-binding protein [candidate division Zixibacteria bacterium]